MTDQDLDAIDRAVARCLQAIAQSLSAIAKKEGSSSIKETERIWDTVFYFKDEAELHHAQAVTSLKRLVEQAGRSSPPRIKNMHDSLVAIDDVLKSVKVLAQGEE